MMFLTDENISFRIAEILEIFDDENEVRALKNYFDPGTKDPKWIAELGKWPERPTVVCGDGRILENPAELVVLRDADLMFVHLAKGWTHIPWKDYVWKIVKAWPAIAWNVHRARTASVFRVRVGGKVELVGPVSGLVIKALNRSKRSTR